VDTPGQIDLLRPESGTIIRSLSTAFDGNGDSLTAADMTNDGFDEIIVANAGGGSENGRVDVRDAFNVTISTFNTAYDDDGDRIAGGDVTNDGADELIVANAGGSGEKGRIDVLNLFGSTISSFTTAYDDDGDSVVVADVTGDGAEDIIVVNDEGDGRVDVHDLFGFKFTSFGNTGYDGDDSVDAGDVNGDGREHRGERPGGRVRRDGRFAEAVLLHGDEPEGDGGRDDRGQPR
jgi:hypothetical protein